MNDNPFSPPTTSPVATTTDPMTPLVKTGLGGWLIVLGITLFISVVVKVMTLAQDLQAVASPAWQSLVTPGSPSYDPLWGPAVWIEFLLTLALLGFNGYVIFLYFSKRSTFARRFTLFAGANIAVCVITLIVCAQIHNFPAEAKQQAIKSVFQALVYLAIWGTYVHKSQRVKHTFVR